MSVRTWEIIWKDKISFANALPGEMLRLREKERASVHRETWTPRANLLASLGPTPKPGDKQRQSHVRPHDPDLCALKARLRAFDENQARHLHSFQGLRP